MPHDDIPYVLGPHGLILPRHLREANRRRLNLGLFDEIPSIHTIKIKRKGWGKPSPKPIREKVPFDWRLLLIKSRDELNTTTSLKCNPGPKKYGHFKCGFCRDNVAPIDWKQHLTEHYGVGWLGGFEEIIDVNDRVSVLEAIETFITKNPTRVLPCRLCQHVERTGTGVLEHLESCGETAEEKQKRLMEELAPLIAARNLASQMLSQSLSLHKAKWNNFVQQHYTDTSLFVSTFTKYDNPTWKVRQDLNKFNEYSMQFTYDLHNNLKDSDDAVWLRLSRFESFTLLATAPPLKTSEGYALDSEFGLNHNVDESLCFVGAAVSAVVWVPLPAHVKTQYLAVLFKMDHSNNSNFIMFYSVNENMDMYLYLTVHMEDGPVRTIAFLPSGGYNSESNRLALMAVSADNSAIKIYPVPLSVRDFVQPYLVTLTARSLLVWDLMMPKYYSCSTIRWSETQGHNYVFAGLDNGYISVWDVRSLHYECTKPLTFLPCSFCFVHASGVVSFDVHYDSNGPRWIAVQSGNEKCTIFDIADLCKFVVVKVEPVANTLRCLDWSPMYATIAVAFPTQAGAVDNVKQTNSNALSLSHIIRNVQCGPNKAMVTSVHYTPWLNLLACGKENGEVVLYECRPSDSGQLNVMFMEKAKTNMAAASVKLEQDPMLDHAVPANEAPPDYFANKKFVLRPTQKIVPKRFVDLAKPDRAELISAVRFNTNAGANAMLCVAYENGFIRVTNYKHKNATSI